MGAMKDLAIELSDMTTGRKPFALRRPPYKIGDLINVGFNCDDGNVRATVPVLDVRRDRAGNYAVTCVRLFTANEYQRLVRFTVDKRGRNVTASPYTGEIWPIFRMT